MHKGRPRNLLSSGVMAAAALVAACADSDDFTVQLATIEVTTHQVAIDSPMVAGVGEPVLIGITTWGGGCTSEERTDIELHDQEVHIYPYNRTRIPSKGSACTQQLLSIPHQAMFKFEVAGNKQITVHGIREMGFSTEPLDVTLTLLIN